MDKSEQIYVKHTQKDHSMAFKLKVVNEIENGELTAT